MEATQLLKKYLEESEGMTHEKFGAALRVSRQTVWSWLNGNSVPGEAAKLDIEEQTGGAVPASSWPVVDRRKKSGDAA